MLFSNGLSYALLISWILLTLALIYLPKIVHSAKLNGVITDNMIVIIKSVLIAYLIISVVTIFSMYVAMYFSGLFFISTR